MWEAQVGQNGKLGLVIVSKNQDQQVHMVIACTTVPKFLLIKTVDLRFHFFCFLFFLFLFGHTVDWTCSQM
jgi:hypothetical protein